ncbi:Yae1 family protein [Thiofilum flexile]|uniref:PD-(D/E)XK nuclease family transposase n=1 Tax=Thiofilum flexile TaxID=125627 RepID=UPI0003626BCF|nr:Yae1 family protein [Thiofilum flexile]
MPLNNLHELETIPAELQESVFQRMFDIAQLSQFSVEERTAYEDSLKHYRDLKNATDTAHSEGIEEGFELGLEKGKELGKQEGLEEGKELGKQEGLEEGKRETARRMLAKGMTVELVAELTGLSVEQVQRF